MIVLSMLKTIFFQAAIWPIRLSNAGIVPYPEVTRKYIAPRTQSDRTKVVTTLFLIRFTITMK